MKKTIWHIRKWDRDVVKRIATENHLTETAACILYNRGLTEQKAIDRFLKPDWDKFHDPYLMKDMNKAVDRILKALKDQEIIRIYGDYDVDGITSTSILFLFLKEIGCRVDYYIPDRFEEGYGVNANAVLSLKEAGTQLLITVDTGITAVKEAILCAELQIDLIITDHHECQEEIPKALAVLNPKQPDCDYPFKMLAGVGVVFKLIQALAEALNIRESINKYLHIVAVGTIADIVPLQDENRIITRLALADMSKTKNVGLKALLKVAAVEENAKINAGIIGFRLAPRLNASGRLGDAKRGVQLFTTEDPLHAAALAEELDAENTKRQQTEQEILEEAITMIEGTMDLSQTKIIVVAGEAWNHGVIGIVASRITEKYYRPSIVLTIEEGKASGSARSVSGFSIYQALYGVKELFNRFGGHEMAAGMSLRAEDVDLLRERLNLYAASVMDESTLIPKLKADGYLSMEEVSLHLIEELSLFEPYGVGNEEPKFICNGRLKDAKVMGKNKTHLKLTLEGGKKQLEAIGFNMAEYEAQIYSELDLNIACTLDINEWNNIKKPQLMIKDMKYLNEYEKELDEAKQLILSFDLRYEPYHVDANHKLYEWIKDRELTPEQTDYTLVYRYLALKDTESRNRLPIM